MEQEVYWMLSTFESGPGFIATAEVSRLYQQQWRSLGLQSEAARSLHHLGKVLLALFPGAKNTQTCKRLPSTNNPNVPRLVRIYKGIQIVKPAAEPAQSILLSSVMTRHGWTLKPGTTSSFVNRGDAYNLDKQVLMDIDMDTQTYTVLCGQSQVDLATWGFPNTLSADVIGVLTKLMRVIRPCKGNLNTIQAMPIGQNISVSSEGGRQFVHDVRCTGIRPFLSVSQCCRRCYKTYHSWADSAKKKAAFHGDSNLLLKNGQCPGHNVVIIVPKSMYPVDTTNLRERENIT